MTEKGDLARSKLLAAMLVSVCYDTFEGCKSLEKPGLNLMLNRHLATCLVDSIKEVKDQFESTDTFDLNQVFSSRTIREFDDRWDIIKHQVLETCDNVQVHSKNVWVQIS